MAGSGSQLAGGQLQQMFSTGLPLPAIAHALLHAKPEQRPRRNAQRLASAQLLPLCLSVSALPPILHIEYVLAVLFMNRL
jgi:hypothetical protein